MGHQPLRQRPPQAGQQPIDGGGEGVAAAHGLKGSSSGGSGPEEGPDGAAVRISPPRAVLAVDTRLAWDHSHVRRMAIRQDDNRPTRRFGLINLLLIGFGVLLLFSNFLPNPAMQVPRVPYSLFIDQVNDDNVKRAFITSEQIRYELKSPRRKALPRCWPPRRSSTWICPSGWSSMGSSSPPHRRSPSFITTALSWVVPPLIFILVLQFFARRADGRGAQGALSFTKSQGQGLCAR